MKTSARTAALLLLAIALLGAAGCGEMAAKVEAAENPAPAGTYEGVSVTSSVSINEKANYAWESDGATVDAIANADTEYYVDGESVSRSVFSDADGNTGVYEGDNEDSMDDTYDFEVRPDGVLSAVNLNMGD
ncbi:MAG: hypothetical protein EG823_04090 [Actinobacteria bacterium]|nr:hypothetical protein [Actinomycetota bacterium]